MELTIKHLAAYLPYGLKGLKISKGNFKTDPNIEEIIDLTISDIGAFLKKRYHVISCKPILRRKSYLNKLQDEIVIRWGGGLGEKAKAQWLHEMTFDMMYSATNSLRYDFVEFMCENHIDIFGLIDSGLAIEMEDSHGR